MITPVKIRQIQPCNGCIHYFSELHGEYHICLLERRVCRIRNDRYFELYFRLKRGEIMQNEAMIQACIDNPCIHHLTRDETIEVGESLQ